jgi:hypothetical protein
VASYSCLSNKRLDDGAAREARALLAGKIPVHEVAKRFCVSVWCIYDLRLGRTTSTWIAGPSPRSGDPVGVASPVSPSWVSTQACR